ncbi:MAG TPA: ComF family protein [Vicinamibacterales bacterium]|jgi:ComF family protein
MQIPTPNPNLDPESRIPTPDPESRTPTPESLLQGLLNPLLAVLLAPRCAACDEPLSDVLAGPVCNCCWRAIRLITPPVCEGCGDPLPSWRAVSCRTARCARCRRTPRAITRGRAIGEYDGALGLIIHALKYDGRRSVAGRLGRLMRESAGDLLHGADCVVPVPLHPKRERARGFNQAVELARTLGLPVCAALVRVRHTAPQVDLPAARRHANVRGAFRLARRHAWLRPFASRRPRLANAIVVLVDDVSTTGATLEACARVLKDAGVREVRALTGARVIRRDPPTRQQSA